MKTAERFNNSDIGQWINCGGEATSSSSICSRKYLSMMLIAEENVMEEMQGRFVIT